MYKEKEIYIRLTYNLYVLSENTEKITFIFTKDYKLNVEEYSINQGLLITYGYYSRSADEKGILKSFSVGMATRPRWTRGHRSRLERLERTFSHSEKTVHVKNRYIGSCVSSNRYFLFLAKCANTNFSVVL